jgi:hypothetical protein
MRLQHLGRASAVLATIGVLAACTITFEPVVEVQRAAPPRPPAARIEFFEPDRGRTASYRVGERIAFDVRTNVDGFVTLSALDANGAVYVFARNVPVRGGRAERIEGIGPRQRFVVDPPLGRHFVRASFTPARTDEIVLYVGIIGYDAWLRQISLELRPFDAHDQRETVFTVRR